MLQYIGIDENKLDNEKIKKYLSLEWFLQLMIGLSNFHNSKTMEFMSEMLKADFSPNGSFTHFSTKP